MIVLKSQCTNKILNAYKNYECAASLQPDSRNKLCNQGIQDVK